MPSNVRVTTRLVHRRTPTTSIFNARLAGMSHSAGATRFYRLAEAPCRSFANIFSYFARITSQR
jgi:hypothetical protein